MKGLAAHTSAFSRLKRSLGLRLSSISRLVAQTKAYCFVANVMACGRLQEHGHKDKDGGWEERDRNLFFQ